MYPTPAPTPDAESPYIVQEPDAKEVKFSLVPQLNTLLHALELPIELKLPTELTPSLLIAMLESLLQAHITVPEISLEPSDPNTNSPSAVKYAQDVMRIKVFIGVLQTDVLREDVGLGDVDPCKLAEGAWDESVFVGELLCWIGRRVGLLPRISAETDDESSSNQSELLTTSLAKPNYPRTSLMSHNNFTEQREFMERPEDGRFAPRCIHEVPSPSEILSELDMSTLSLPLLRNSGNTPNSSVNLSVRYEGYIQPVDEELELSSFEAGRSMHQAEMRGSRHHDNEADPNQPIRSQLSRSRIGSGGHARMVELLFERARLLEELALLPKK